FPGAVREDVGVSRHAVDSDPVAGRGDDAGDVRAVAAVVRADRVDARRHVARTVDVGTFVGEVPAQRPAEVGREVRVRGVDARVDDADGDAAAGRLLLGLL